MRVLLTMLVLGCLLSSLACDDDDAPPEQLDLGASLDWMLPDGLGPWDQGPGADVGQILDGPKANDAIHPGDGKQKTDSSDQPLDCQAISECSDTCAASCKGSNKLPCLLACNTDCAALGCASAQQLFTALSNCIQTQCLVECMNGPNTTCSNCVDSSCSAEVAACNADSC